MKKLYLVRHAHTKDNEEEKYSGFSDTVLSETGKKQSRGLCEFLKANIDVDRIYVSGLRRTKDTIEEYAKFKGIEPIKKEGLNEMNFGNFDGLTLKEIEERYPDDYKEFMKGKTLFRFPDGENIEDVYNRNAKAFREIFEETKDVDNVLIAGHMGSVRNIISHLLVDSYELHWNIKIENATISIFEFLDDFPVLKMMGFIPYDINLLRPHNTKRLRKDK